MGSVCASRVVKIEIFLAFTRKGTVTTGIKVSITKYIKEIVFSMREIKWNDQIL